jgi:hypothetical protein
MMSRMSKRYLRAAPKNELSIAHAEAITVSKFMMPFSVIIGDEAVLVIDLFQTPAARM